MRRPPLTDIVRNLPALVPFVGPEAQERARGRPFRARLGANESLFGPSPKAIRVMEQAAAENWKYSDPESHDLRHALARFHGVAPDNIVIGEGIDGLLGLAVRMAGRARASAVVTSDGAYPTFNFHVAGPRRAARQGSLPRTTRRTSTTLLDAVVRESGAHHLRRQPRQSDGNVVERRRDRRLIERASPRRLLCLDEAYCDTAPRRRRPAGRCRQPPGAALPHVLQGLWARRRPHRLLRGRARPDRDLREGAKPLRHQPRRPDRRARRARRSGLSCGGRRRRSYARERIAAIARSNGLEPLPSAANFVTIDCGGDGAFASRVLDGLLDARRLRQEALPPRPSTAASAFPAAVTRT